MRFALEGKSPLAPSNIATIIQAEIIENGDALAVLVKERDGSISAVRIAVSQLAD